jgi:NADH-quinone oxidoreductase subunit G
MAAVADVQLVNISINDVELQVPKGELVVEAVKRLGLEVPIFCYHPRMKPVGMCRMCLVEVAYKMPDGSVRKMPKPQTACTLPCTEGLQVFTDTQTVHNDRKGVLEFLLINHPLDCPICDRGGECPLQNNTLFYGPSTSRYVEIKRHAPKAYPLSQYVTLDLERCIQCGRCVRFTEEISGDAQLALRFRGARTQPGTFELRNFESKFSGNVIEICPVGALTSSKYRFRARPWDLQTRPAICTFCSGGCNIHMDYRTNEIVRINGRTNEAVNEEWTCDRGKFGHYIYNTEKRSDTPFIRKGDKLVAGEWSEAYAEILTNFKGSSVAALAGPRLTNEDFFALTKLFRGHFGSDNLDHRFERILPTVEQDLPARLEIDTVQNTIQSFEDAKRIFVFGTSLADEIAVLFLRVRKAWFNKGTKVIVAHHAPTDVDSFADLVLRYREGTADILASGLVAALAAAGKVTLPPGYAQALGKFTPEQVEAATGVRAADLKAAAEFLSEGAATITTRGLYDVENGSDAAETLAGLATVTGGTFNRYARQSNEEGADLLGVRPLSGGRDTHAILQGCIDGSVSALWLAGVDPFQAHPDRALVQRALESVPFLVVQHFFETEATGYASVVLPMTAPSETQGSYTNMERRIQSYGPVLPEKGSAKPVWRALTELSLRIKPARPHFHAKEVLDAIASDVPAFAGVSWDGLKGEGYLLGQGPDENALPRIPVEANG